MAVAAYASVLSLMGVLENALHRSRRRFLPNPAQIESLQEKLTSLRDLLEVHPSKISKEIEDLTGQIPGIINEADDIIDNYMVDRIHGSYMHRIDTGLNSSSFCQNVDRVVRLIESMELKLMVLIKNQKMGISDRNHKVHIRESSSEDAFLKDKHTVVGLEKPSLEIMDKLTGQRSNLQVIPITGMPGIGKTTLARIVFDNKCIMDSFTIRIWLTVSQDYDVYQILEGLLNDGVLGDRKNRAGDDDAYVLGELLYKKLSGRRYLIVMDDVWSTEAWDDLRSFFPDNANRSRIIVTTRLSSVANALGSKDTYLMDFLDEDDSWDLFSKMAFARGGQSHELIEIGKKIAKSCRGLPLSLVVTGGLLANSEMTREHWELVAKNVNSFANSGNNENCLKLLYLSYNYLPIHLKPCFLYMGVYPEDSEVDVSELQKLWIAEGFLKPLRDKTSEETALRYLNDLIDRNIIGIRKLGSRGNVKSCGVHDLLRDLCVREYEKERLFSVPRTQQLSFYTHEGMCFLCANYGEHERVNLGEVNLFRPTYTSFVRPLACDTCRTKYPQLIGLRFVRMIDSIGGDQVEIPQTTKSRYVRIFQYGNPVSFVSPSPITLLWNLQTSYVVTLPAKWDPVSEIWEMPQLRHLHMGRRALSDPAMTDDPTVLENLQTLTYVSDFRCTEEVVKRIPNLKKLGLLYNIAGGSEMLSWSDYCLHNLPLLDKLESMFLRCYHISLGVENVNFPCSLKKLSLEGCRLSWEDVNTFGLLPNLASLKLLYMSVVGDEWNPIEEGFSKLKYLKIEYLEFMRWIADETHFPALETLTLYCVRKLENIPLSFGDIETLQTIMLESSSDSVVESAKEMIDEQQSNGNESLQLHVVYPVRTYHFGGPS